MIIFDQPTCHAIFLFFVLQFFYCSSSKCLSGNQIWSRKSTTPNRRPMCCSLSSIANRKVWPSLSKRLTTRQLKRHLSLWFIEIKERIFHRLVYKRRYHLINSSIHHQCILTEFRHLPSENQKRQWDVLVGKAPRPCSTRSCRPFSASL